MSVAKRFMNSLSTYKLADGSTFYYRPGTTDEKVLAEVVTNRCYRRPSAGFDVDPGERWLDLGANVGAFAAYCRLNGATAECYEPEPTCYSILLRNAPGFVCHRATVTHRRETVLTLWPSGLEGNHYRGTVVEGTMRVKGDPLTVPNVYAGSLTGRFDGVKMDIEGSEFGLIDNGLIPPCEKLCLEYHTSRDRSMANLGRRLDVLRSLFDVVAYVPELDRLLVLGGMQKSFHDRVIYCRGRKGKTKTPAGSRGR